MTKELINKLKLKWGKPAHAIHNGEETIFKLSCQFSSTGVAILENYPYKLPIGLVEFWSIAESAQLFKDCEYSQWGLEILPPDQALSVTEIERSYRSEEIGEWDLVVGRFFGDSDLLIISCDKNDRFGNINIALPNDPKDEWPDIAHNFTEFLKKYSDNEGAKYWEQ